MNLLSLPLRTLPWVLLPSACWILQAEISEKDLVQANQATEQGIQALESGDLDKAKKFFDRAVGSVTSYPEAHLGLGHILMKQNKYEGALDEYLRAKEGYAQIGDDIYSIRVRGYDNIRRQISTLRDALRSLQQSRTNTKGDTTQLDRKIANTEESIKKYEAIQPPVKDAAKEAPSEVFFHIGNAQNRLNRINEAVASWEISAKKNPSFGLVHNNLAVAYMRKGMYSEAKASLLKAEALGVKVHPKFKEDLENKMKTDVK